jgi:hypothetical protein
VLPHLQRHPWHSSAQRMQHGHRFNGTILSRSGIDAGSPSDDTIIICMSVSSQASMPVAEVMSSLHDACCNAATDSPSQDRRRGVHSGGAPPAWARRTLCTAPPARCRLTASCTSRCWAGPASMRGALPRQVPAAAAKVGVWHRARCRAQVRAMWHDTSCCTL